MKKRIVCVLLTLIMLLSLVPMGASAAAYKTSEAAITVLKQMTIFTDTCSYFNGTEFRTGYGTVCEEKHVFNVDGTPFYKPAETIDGVTVTYYDHKITEKNADLALRKALLALDEKVNSFASANGLSLTQNQHDALVIFSYDAGSDWMIGNGVVKSALINGCDANELLNAMNLWTNNAHMDRRKVEVNMYMNGIYSNTVPSSYGKVIYYPAGGSMPQADYDNPAQYTYYYDIGKIVEHPVIPTKKDNLFLGWYVQESLGAVWTPALGSFCNGEVLVAHWQPIGASYLDAKPVRYEIAKAHLASFAAYDISTGKVNETWTAELIKELDENGTVAVDRDYIDKDGNRWSRLRNGSLTWVKVGNHTGGSIDGVEVFVDVTVTVTNNRLNRRVNASIASAINGSYNQGDQLRIINTDYADGFLWGQVAASATDNTPIGWVALMHTNWNSVKDNDNSNSSVNNGTVIGTATVTVNGYLNLRNEAGTDGKIIGALAKNDTVDLYEIKTVNGQQWGRSKSGWLCLTYTRVLLKENVIISDMGALVYAFTGVYNGSSDLVVRVEPNDNSNAVTYYIPNAFDPTKDDIKTELSIPKKMAGSAGTSVVMTNMFVVNGERWVRATWQNPEWDWKSDKIADGVNNFNVTRSGWIKFNQIAMDPATFTVAANTVNVRTAAGDAAKLAFTLNKGVQVEVDDISLVNENLWGHIHVKLLNHVGVMEAKDGWVNLASKYFSRNGAPSIEETNSPNTGLIATVINTDALKVRNTGASYGTKIGTLARGTTVAVWESNEDDWYKVDSNGNGVYDYEDDGWCSGAYLDIRQGTADGSSTVTDSNGNQYQTDGTGKGIVANTYSGVNVRTGPGTGYAANGKLLPGTVVEILETANAGKWGRVAQGWISMDYVTMVTYNEMIPDTTPNGGTTVESFDKADKTTTTAVYTGVLNAGTVIYRTPEEEDSERIRITTTRENVTMYELATVTKVVESEKQDIGDKTTTTTITTTTYWARINDGWVKNPDICLTLDALDEKVHTQTGVSKLNVRKGTDTDADDAGAVFDVLVQGDQVNVTALDIIKDKVWGRIDTNEGTGWIRLDYMSEGAVYVKAPVQNKPTAPTAPVLGNTSSTGGFVNNSSGYRYTGKVIRANEVNVRATPSTAAAKTTSLKNGAALVIYETTIAENMAWGRCDAGWIYLYYVDLTPVVNGAVDARVVYNDNTIIYTDVNASAVAGTYARMSVIDIYEIVGKMARTDLGWVDTDNLL